MGTKKEVFILFPKISMLNEFEFDINLVANFEGSYFILEDTHIYISVFICTPSYFQIWGFHDRMLVGFRSNYTISAYHH